MTATIKPAPTVIELNETGYYNALDPRIERVTGVYLFDRASHTHIADTSPSYELIALYPNVYLKDEDTREDNMSLIEEYEEDWRKTTNGSDYSYVRTIEAIIKNGAKIYESKKEPDDDESYEDFMEECREYYSGNHMI